MKTWPFAMVVASVLAFLLGRQTASVERRTSPDVAANESRVRATTSLEKTEDKAFPTSRRAPRRDDHLPKEPRVSIPLSAVTSILKERQFSYSDFDDINRKLPDALTILGATAGEKEAALAVMTRTRAYILEEEKAHVRVAKADESGITLDRSGMENSSKRAVEDTQKGLRETLPSDSAEALIASIDWERFYFNGNQETSFRITRNANGSLAATTATGTGSFSSGLRSEQYPDDGTAIPAEALFDKRWSSFLHGKSLLPVNN